MKLQVKNTAKRVSLFAVDYIAAPLHIACQLTTNVMQVITDGVAMGEGFVTEKIDPSQDRETVATNRVEYTQAKFHKTAMELQAFKAKMQSQVDKSNDKLDDIKSKFNSDKPQANTCTAMIVITPE